MKLITYYTETHKDLYENYFVNSLHNIHEFEVFKKCGTQHSTDGNYFSNGFNETTKDKILFLLETLEQSVNEDEVVLFSDVDVIFFSKIKSYFKRYQEYDMVFQNGIGGLNTGFFTIKNSEEVRKLLKNVVSNCHLFDNDQIALNFLIKSHNIKFTMFDDEIFSVAHTLGPKVWSDEEFILPDNVLVFHACWCAGVNKKKKLLDYVRNYRKIKTE